MVIRHFIAMPPCFVSRRRRNLAILMVSLSNNILQVMAVLHHFHPEHEWAWRLFVRVTGFLFKPVINFQRSGITAGSVADVIPYLSNSSSAAYHQHIIFMAVGRYIVSDNSNAVSVKTPFGFPSFPMRISPPSGICVCAVTPDNSICF